MVDQNGRGGQTTKGNVEARIGVLSDMASTPEPPPGTPHPSDPGGTSGDGPGPGRVEIPEEDQALIALCRVDTFRAGGPGGQHQNVTESAVRLTHLPTGTVVVARDERSQHRNRSLALARLRKALEALNRVDTPRVPTRVPRIQKVKRREAKSRRSQIKRSRRPPRAEE